MDKKKDFVEFMADTLCIVEDVFDEDRIVKGAPDFINKKKYKKLYFWFNVKLG